MGSGAVVQGLAGCENYQARRFRRSCSVFGCIVRLAITLAHPHSLQRGRFTNAVIGASGLRLNRAGACWDNAPSLRLYF
jgi:hypothetical protein